MSAAVVILAGGAGTRVGSDTNKVLLELGGVPLLVHSLRTALAVPGVDEVVLVARPGEEQFVEAVVGPHLGAREALLVPGGGSRHVSEWHGIQALAEHVDNGEVDVIAVHDAARPLADVDLFVATIDAARAHGGAVPTVSVPALVTTDLRLPATDLIGVQTPQAFRAAPLLAAHRRAAAEGFEGTDTAAVVERYADLAIVGVPGSASNLKVTFPEDVALAATLSVDL